MPKQHATMRRVYDAAIRHKVIKGANQLTELAEVLEVEAPQRVKNWDTRGASAEAMLLIQKKTGINATWIELGEGPEMVAGWPPGRREDPVPEKAQGTYYTPRNVLASLQDLASVLDSVQSTAGRHRMAEMLSALALAPDSKSLLDSIKAEVTAGQTPASAAAESKHEDASRAWRKQAMRLAEAHPDERSKSLLSDFIAKLDTVMRGDAAPAGKTARTKG